MASVRHENRRGLDVPDEALLDGETFDLTFPTPVTAVGLFVITSDPATANEIQLETDAVTAFNAATPDPMEPLPDGGLRYFLGLVADTPVTTAQLRFAADGESNFAYTVDDITTATAPGPGDLTGDGQVNIDDLNVVLSCFGQTVAANPGCASADVNEDGVINILDVSFVGSQFTTP